MKEIRSLFPGAEAQVYFDVGVRGLLSSPVREAVDRYLDARMMGSGDKDLLRGFAEGARESFAALINADHAEVALLLVDAAQSVGAIDIDVHALGIDALAVATQKCLLAFYGFGFLWVRRSLADKLMPGHVARYGIDLGEGAHETALGSGELRFQPGARRFDLGNFNYLGAAAAQASIELLRSISMKQVEAHLRSLAARLAAALLELGLPVAGGAPGEHLAHIVSVGESGGGRHYTADDPAMNELYDHLARNGVQLSIRRGVLRMSLGIYNNEADVDRVVALTREWIDGSGPGGS